MKKSKDQYQTAENASKLHKHVGELLVELFPLFEVRQEYSVSSVNPEFTSNREKFDWVVLGLRLAIEVMGEQHFRPVCFGGIEIDKAKVNFRKQQERDQEKKEAAVRAGWVYVTVKYDEQDITADQLMNRIYVKGLSREVAADIAPPKPKIRIIGRGFAKKPEGHKHQWPTKKIPSKPFKQQK